MSDSLSTAVSLFHQTSAELLRSIREHRRWRYRWIAAPTGHLCMTRESGGPVVATGILPGFVIIQGFPGDERAGKIVLRGLSEAEAIRRCDAANAGEGLDLHLRN